jgi:peptide chain release factor 1
MSLSASMMAKLSDLTDRFDEVSALLSDPETMADRDRFTALSKEYAELEPLILTFRRHDVLDTELREAQELAGDEDPEMRELAREDVDRLSKALDEEEQELQTLLLPRDPSDASNVYLEIRAGTGGASKCWAPGQASMADTRRSSPVSPARTSTAS